MVGERLLRESDLKLQKAIKMCRADELPKQQIKLLANKDNHVNQVRRSGASRLKEKHKVIESPETKQKSTDGKQEQKRGALRNCSLIFSKGQFTVRGKQCNRSKKMNHYARMCRANKTVHSCDQQREHSSEYLFLESKEVRSVDQIRESETEHVIIVVK